MDDLTRRRLDNLIKRQRAYAEQEIENVTALTRGLNLALEPGVTLGQAERLAASATALLRYVSTLSGIDAASGLLGDA